MNQIKNVLKKRGIEDLRPTDEVLKKMGVTIHIWNKWVAEKKDPNLQQLEIIAEFIGCEVSDLIPKSHERASV